MEYNHPGICLTLPVSVFLKLEINHLSNEYHKCPFKSNSMVCMSVVINPGVQRSFLAGGGIIIDWFFFLLEDSCFTMC